MFRNKIYWGTEVNPSISLGYFQARLVVLINGKRSVCLITTNALSFSPFLGQVLHYSRLNTVSINVSKQ